MSSRSSGWKRWFLIAGAALCVVGAASAQTMKSGQRVIFSGMDDQASAAPATNSMEPREPAQTPFANAIKPSLFNFNPPMPSPTPAATPVPLPRMPVISPAEAARMQQATDRQKNWALMTPAEIMGVPTAQQIMGIPERDASGEIKNQTAEERYYERELKSESQRTNATSAHNNLSSDLNGPQSEGMNGFGGQESPARPFDLFGNDISGQSPAGANPADRPFNLPTRTRPAQTPEQIASANEFQKLLQPHVMAARSEPVTPAPAPASRPFQNPTFNSPATPISAFNNDSIAQAVIRPLISAPKKETSTTPAWKPQLPPWMSDEPQFGTVPQRKF